MKVEPSNHSSQVLAHRSPVSQHLAMVGKKTTLLTLRDLQHVHAQGMVAICCNQLRDERKEKINKREITETRAHYARENTKVNDTQ